MHKSLVFSLAIALCAAPLLAQENAPADTRIAQAKATPSGEAPAPAARTARSASASPVPAPAATPEPKKRGFFGRVFGGKERATPAPTTPGTPAPAGTPRPVRRSPRKATPAADAAEKTDTTPSPEKSKPEDEKTAPPEKAAATPKPAEAEKVPQESSKPETPAPAATPTPGKKGSKKAGKPTPAPRPEAEQKPQTKEQIAVQQAIASGDTDAIEKAKYNEAKARALEDERVKGLKQKADEAPSEEEARKALRAYNKALFQKIRSLQPAIKERADRMEAAVLKQLGE